MGFYFRLLYCAIRFLAIWLLQSRWNAFDVCLICLSPIEVYSSLKDTMSWYICRMLLVVVLNIYVFGGLWFFNICFFFCCYSDDSCSPSVDTIPPLLFRRRYIVMVFVSFNIWF
ncbi:hypothetical protein Hanom_Chr08g00705651 [Helianthus anomalus]